MDAAGTSGLGSLLRAVSAFGSSRGLTHTGFIHCALGSAQIQETPDAQAAGLGLVAASENAATDPVRALDARSHGWTIGAVWVERLTYSSGRAWRCDSAG